MFRIGPAGWNYKDWAGIVYPAKRPPGFSEPGFLAQFFDVLEINTSFYGPPRPQSSARWVEAIAFNPEFRFTAKLWRGFTHERNATPEDVRVFHAGMEPIVTAGRLGAILMQFPISFRNTPENLAYLDGLYRRFRAFPLVLEVRQSGWNDASVLDWLAEREIGMCNIDQPLLGRALRPEAHSTAPVGYIRLHGRNYANWFAENKSVNERYDYLYSAKELETWADRAKTVARRSEDVYVVTNNHNLGKSVANAALLLPLLGRALRVAPSWIEHYPEVRPRERS